MTKENKDKILHELAEERNSFVRDCNMRIAQENGKITGVDYMMQRFLEHFMVGESEGNEC